MLTYRIIRRLFPLWHTLLVLGCGSADKAPLTNGDAGDSESVDAGSTLQSDAGVQPGTGNGSPDGGTALDGDAGPEVTPGVDSGPPDVDAGKPGVDAGKPGVDAGTDQFPIAGDDEYDALEDVPLAVDAAIGVLANDTDPALGSLQAILVDDATDGAVTLFADGSFDYVPNPDFAGLDNFSYRASNGTHESSLTTVTLNVVPVNDAPSAVDDTFRAPSGDVLAVDAAGGVLANDTDPELDALQAQLVSDALSGSVLLEPDGSFEYTPNPEFIGTDSFTYLVSDAEFDSNVATVTVVVLERPLPAADSYTSDEDATLVIAGAAGVLANDTDGNSPHNLIAELVSGPSQGTLTSFSPDGAFTYLPNGDFHGIDSFTYRAVDSSNGTFAEADVTLTINPVNDPPRAASDAYATGVGQLLVVNAETGVLANDRDVDSAVLSAVLQVDASNGQLILDSDGSFEYQPNPGFSGLDSFTYAATDGVSSSDTVVVTLRADNTNRQPYISTGRVGFAKQLVAEEVDQTHAIAAADFTGDGELDLIATDFVDGAVYWYENDGNGGFIPHVLDPDLPGAYPAGVGDVDADGDMDVMAAGYESDTFVWYESDNAGGFTRHDIDTSADGAHSIVLGDVDGDGDPDFVTSSQDANRIGWYENDGLANFTLHVIDSEAELAKRAELADMDGDGDMDVVTATNSPGEVAWYENDGTQTFTKRSIDTAAAGAYFVAPADIDGDGDLDLFSANQLEDAIAWYRNDGAGRISAKTVIDARANKPRRVMAVDINGDGFIDAVSANKENDEIFWYANDGRGNFTQQIVDGAASGAYGIFAADINKDGLIDILSASRDSGELAIHPQRRDHLARVELGGNATIDSSLLLTEDPDDAPEQLTYTLTSSPISGTLQLSGAPLADGSTFTQRDVNDGLVVYVDDGVDEYLDALEFTVADGGESETRPLLGRFQVAIADFEGTVAYLPLDEGSGSFAQDVSGSGNHGEFTGAATFGTDTRDGNPAAARFDGADGVVNLGRLDVVGSGLTMAAWFKADSFPGENNDPRIISKATGAAADRHIFMLSTTKVDEAVRLRARVRVGGTTETLVADAGDLSTGQWYHAAATYDRSTLRLYLDGTQVGQVALAGPVDQDPLVGVTVGGQPFRAAVFHGLIDEVRLLNRSMSPEELNQL